jgi:phosphoadenylyl-sulfate reductase (thioredoxin)
MSDIFIDDIKDQEIERLNQLDAPELLRFAFGKFGDRAAIGTSLQKTGVVTIDLASRLGIPFRVFFIDTLKNHTETYELLVEVENRYNIKIERFAANEDELHSLYGTYGQYAHFLARARCCHARKTVPLQRAMATMDVWISGLRADQSKHRGQEARKASFAFDSHSRKLLKMNPMLDWTLEQIDDYTKKHDLPYNKLYDYVSPYGERYTTIGCEECHIPIQEELDPRAGKFPWEQGAKECGLHIDGSGI